MKMAVAFVLINTEVGSEEKVLETIKAIPVKDVAVIYGYYDIICRVEADNMDKLKEIVNTKIRKLDLIRATLTLIVVDAER